MSMDLLTVLQTVSIFCVYTFIVCGLSFAVLNKKLLGFRLSVKWMLCFGFGNFYIINLVLILQLLHISNIYTLLAGTFLPFFAALIRIHNYSVKKHVLDAALTIQRVANQEQGVKSLLRKFFVWLGKKIKRAVLHCARVIRRNPVDLLLFAAVTGLIIWIYGHNLVTYYGYCASDIPVHNFWINYMSRDQVFVDGVYPFGFHCIIYYLHAAFGFHTFVLLRVFCFIQTLYIHWMLLLFLKGCLKSGYMAYAGTGIYAAVSFFQGNTYTRFASSLPQEFGMTFILPAIYFGFAFFFWRKRQTDEADEKERAHYKKLAFWCLVGFAMHFSLTLAVHFYGTIIAGLFCVAMAIAYFFRFFRKQYFLTVVVTVIISVASAVLPMGIAFVTGTPLQGSLDWAMGVMSGSGSDSAADTAETEPTEIPETPVSGGEQQSGEGAGGDGGEIQSAPPRPGLVERLKNLFGEMCVTFNEMISMHDDLLLQVLFFGSMLGCPVLALAFFIKRDNDYGAMLLSVSGFMMILFILLNAVLLGLPELMDSNRCSIYLCYAMPAMFCFAADGVLYLLFGWLKSGRVLDVLSLGVCGLTVWFAVSFGYVKSPPVVAALESNDAVTCLTNIMYEMDDWTWTIVSANDELRMGEDNGYHFEIIDLLRQMEMAGKYANVTIPTKYVYFFVEKIPLDYAVWYEDSGQRISEEGALRALPNVGGLAPYQGENRWIIMSRMYYWAEAFRQLYPNEFKVYYETDSFICYQLEQNVDSLYDLSIDYHYNMLHDEKSEEEKAGE